MVEERERACDEEVLGRGSNPEVYAESVLKICEFCLESPLACVSGVTGADLKRRIVQIMSGRLGLKLGVGMKLLLLAVALVVIAVPVASGLYGQTALPDSVKVFHAAGPMPSYEVATIKRPDESTEQGRAFMAGARASGGRGLTIRGYIQSAYGIPIGSRERVVGGPAWISSEFYIIQEKVPDEIQDTMQKMTPADRLNENRMMQQMLLQERFKLKVHFETREMPVFELVAAKGGLKIKEVPPPPPGPLPPRRAGGPLPPGMDMRRIGNGHMEMTAMATTMPVFISRLANQEDLNGRPIVDKTGFTGNFDVVGMTWTPPGLPAAFGGSDPGGTSLFTTLNETLGMKLVPGKAPVEVVVIDSIERPSEN
jgi:bla regulator protein blaR1